MKTFERIQKSCDVLNTHIPSRRFALGSGAGVPGFETHSLPYQLWESGPVPDLPGPQFPHLEMGVTHTSASQGYCGEGRPQKPASMVTYQFDP